MRNLLYHSRFMSQIDRWTPIRSHYTVMFNNAEIDALIRSANFYNNLQRRVVILAFENRYAALGGLSSVIRYLPKYLAESGENVIFFTPFHKNNASIQKACSEGSMKKVFSGLNCNLGKSEELITCYKGTDNAITTYYLDIDGFFNADQDPYCYPDKKELIKDALAFCCAVPFVLKKIGIEENILIHANDWETAPSALSLKLSILSGLLKSAKIVFTLHNSYDEYVPEDMFEYFFGRRSLGRTALQICLPLLDAPLTTVSELFAHELTNDPLQKEVFADHLQTFLSMNPPIGIRNGLFDLTNRVFGKEAASKAGKGQIDFLLNKKMSLRKKLIKSLKDIKDKRIIGRLAFKNNKDDIPLFLLSGRLDMMQKGYDVIFHAFGKLERGSAKLIFTPSNPVLGKSEAYKFFTDYAYELDGDIIILPFIIPEDSYREMLGGSSFLVMPSFYEPFGAATEGYLNGTPVIARGTGGLWIQVESTQPCYIPSYLRSFFDHDKRGPVRPTGILFHEDFPEDAIKDEWRSIFSGSPKDRLSSKLYNSMVNSAYKTLDYAINIFHNKEKYGKLITNGFDILSQFSWKDTVKKYKKVYDCVLRRAL